MVICYPQTKWKTAALFTWQSSNKPHHKRIPNNPIRLNHNSIIPLLLWGECQEWEECQQEWVSFSIVEGGIYFLCTDQNILYFSHGSKRGIIFYRCNFHYFNINPFPKKHYIVKGGLYFIDAIFITLTSIHSPKNITQ